MCWSNKAHTWTLLVLITLLGKIFNRTHQQGWTLEIILLSEKYHSTTHKNHGCSLVPKVTHISHIPTTI
jgi:hypothetical protein